MASIGTTFWRTWLCVCKGRAQGSLASQLTVFMILVRVHLHNLMIQFLIINPLIFLIVCPSLENPVSCKLMPFLWH